MASVCGGSLALMDAGNYVGTEVLRIHKVIGGTLYTHDNSLTSTACYLILEYSRF